GVDHGPALRHRAHSARPARQRRAGLDHGVPLRGRREHVRVQGQRRGRQDRAAAAPAPAPRERLGHAHRAIDRPLPSRQPADGPAPGRRGRPLRARGEQHARRHARAQLAREILPADAREAMSSGRGGAPTAATIATADALTRFTRDVFQRAGMSEVHAATVADVLVWASLRGVDSHGIARIAVPGGARGPVVLDMSTGVVARGRLVQASKTGQPIPAGWALDRNGNPTTDPREALTLLPQGGAKGSGLSLMIELITSLVVSNPIIAEALEGTDEGGR